MIVGQDLYSETYYGISSVDDPTGPAPCPNGVIARGETFAWWPGRASAGRSADWTTAADAAGAD